MAVTIRIPTPLRNLTGGQDTVSANGANVWELIEDLERNHPGLKERLCDDKGELRRFVNVYLNQEDIRFKEGKRTAVQEGDELSIVPAIAGGA